jgi:hypothetical protein
VKELQDILPEARSLPDEFTAMATVVRTAGSSYLRPGAKLLGPKRRREKLLADLAEHGLVLPHISLFHLYNPAGLDLGAESAEEIALSITAEIKTVLSCCGGGSLRWHKTSSTIFVLRLAGRAKPSRLSHARRRNQSRGGRVSKARTAKATARSRRSKFASSYRARCDRVALSFDRGRPRSQRRMRARELAGCAHAGTLGTPTAFGRFYFDDLTGLPDDTGAKVLLIKYHDAVVSVPFPAELVDVDTAIDYTQWQDGRE